MPRATKNSACVMNTSVCQENSASEESSSSHQEMEVQAQVFNHLQVKHNLCPQCSCLIMKDQHGLDSQ